MVSAALCFRFGRETVGFGITDQGQQVSYIEKVGNSIQTVPGLFFALGISLTFPPLYDIVLVTTEEQLQLLPSRQGCPRVEDGGRSTKR